MSNVSSGGNFKSYKKDVIKAITDAEIAALIAMGHVGEGWITANSPVETGNLRGSNDHIIDPDELSVTYYNSAEYAPYLELGTSRMSAQPFFRNTIESRLNDLKQIAVQYMKL